ncbi:DUF2268 domain-containing protein [Halalkalibacterium ligniniphilum]|uniref:DUF2268 domain-containing protein n=1 Tax=Halalkalibacterium ligniniphilum TaxID=1134413 RepID=UPI00034AE838|nr:DUF2268 domain-containing putative Zn-dependent protease [Halalkalibacterium ligniniphilum]
MGTVRTDKWLTWYLTHLRKATFLGQRYELQRKYLILPLKKIFRHPQTDQLHQQLLMQGLFYPDEDISFEYQALVDKQVWHVVQRQYTVLKEKWEGPDIPIYVFPVTKKNPLIWKQLGGKMGVSFADKILLFVHGDLEEEQIQALVTHEYHHSCRIVKTNEREETMSLLESIVMEGLAEKAVYEEIGSQALASWTAYYPSEQIDRLWQIVRNNLTLKGREAHHIFLYGDGRRIPQWTGYFLGYQLIDSVVKKDKNLTTTLMLPLSAKKLLEKSSFKSR